MNLIYNPYHNNNNNINNNSYLNNYGYNTNLEELLKFINILNNTNNDNIGNYNTFSNLSIFKFLFSDIQIFNKIKEIFFINNNWRNLIHSLICGIISNIPTIEELNHYKNIVFNINNNNNINTYNINIIDNDNDKINNNNINPNINIIPISLIESYDQITIKKEENNNNNNNNNNVNLINFSLWFENDKNLSKENIK